MPRTWMLLVSALPFAGYAPPLLASPTETLSSGEAGARDLYDAGQIRYDSADYPGAIELFTEALAIVVAEGGDVQVRLTLLYNIARAHEAAFTIDRELAHLRQALSLYGRYLDFARQTGDEEGAARVEGMIREIELQLAGDTPEAGPAELQRSAAPTDQVWRRPRTIGIGLLAGGGAVAVAGIVMAVAGSQLEPAARDTVAQLNDLGLPPDDPAWAEGEAFIVQEKQRGAIFMGVGGAMAVLGAVGIGVGVQQIVRSKRIRAAKLSLAPGLAPDYAGLLLSGSF